MEGMDTATLVFFRWSCGKTEMSLRTLDGQPVGVALQSGVVNSQTRGCDLVEVVETSKNGSEETKVWIGGDGKPYTCTDDADMFGMPTWLFWTLIGTVVVLIITVVAANMARHRRSGERRYRR